MPSQDHAFNLAIALPKAKRAFDKYYVYTSAPRKGVERLCRQEAPDKEEASKGEEIASDYPQARGELQPIRGAYAIVVSVEVVSASAIRT